MSEDLSKSELFELSGFSNEISNLDEIGLFEFSNLDLDVS